MCGGVWVILSSCVAALFSTKGLVSIADAAQEGIAWVFWRIRGFPVQTGQVSLGSPVCGFVLCAEALETSMSRGEAGAVSNEGRQERGDTGDTTCDVLPTSVNCCIDTLCRWVTYGYQDLLSTPLLPFLHLFTFQFLSSSRGSET